MADQIKNIWVAKTISNGTPSFSLFRTLSINQLKHPTFNTVFQHHHTSMSKLPYCFELSHFEKQKNIKFTLLLSTRQTFVWVLFTSKDLKKYYFLQFRIAIEKKSYRCCNRCKTNITHHFWGSSSAGLKRNNILTPACSPHCIPRGWDWPDQSLRQWRSVGSVFKLSQSLSKPGLMVLLTPNHKLCKNLYVSISELILLLGCCIMWKHLITSYC